MSKGFLSGLFSKLEAAYAELDGSTRARADYLSLPVATENACGTCRSCCQASLNPGEHHRVTDLELAYLEDRHGSSAAQAFAAYTRRETDQSGQLRHPVCPNYDTEVGGCRIYNERPFSCRLYGHHREEQIPLDPKCVYSQCAIPFDRTQYGKIPGVAALRRLNLEFGMLRRTNPSNPSGPRPALGRRLAAQDPFDRALECTRRGDHIRARQELDRARESYGASAYAYYNSGLVKILMHDYEGALEDFVAACEALPNQVDFLYYAGSVGCMLGHTEAGRRRLEQVLTIDPHHARTLAFLATFSRPAEAASS